MIKESNKHKPKHEKEHKKKSLFTPHIHFPSAVDLFSGTFDTGLSEYSFVGVLDKGLDPKSVFVIQEQHSVCMLMFEESFSGCFQDQVTQGHWLFAPTFWVQVNK